MCSWPQTSICGPVSRLRELGCRSSPQYAAPREREATGVGWAMSSAHSLHSCPLLPTRACGASDLCAYLGRQMTLTEPSPGSGAGGTHRGLAVPANTSDFHQNHLLLDEVPERALGNVSRGACKDPDSPQAPWGSAGPPAALGGLTLEDAWSSETPDLNQRLHPGGSWRLVPFPW